MSNNKLRTFTVRPQVPQCPKCVKDRWVTGGKPRLKLVTDFDKLIYLECPECGAVYSSPQDAKNNRGDV